MHRLRVFMPGLVLVLILALGTLSVALGLQQDDPAGETAPVTATVVTEPPATPVGPMGPSWDELRLSESLHQTLESAAERYPTDSREAWVIWRELTRFYENRGHHPAWVDARGRFAMAGELIDRIREAGAHGLDPRNYPVDDLEVQLAEAQDADPRRWSELDIELTYLYITYARHLAQGRVDPRDLDTNWHHPQRVIDYAQSLEEALALGRVGASLDGMLPDDPQYRALETTLDWFHEADWPLVQGSFIAGQGDTVVGLSVVRDFLKAVGDLPAGPEYRPELMDLQLAEAVRAFQGRHGLKPDGVIGPQTIRQMQVASRERLQTVLVNMERRRWLGDPIPDRALVVNIPEYRLRVLEEGEVVFSMKAITGTDSTQTPAFADAITYLELNPVWHIPRSIAGNELLPKILADSTYLVREEISVHDSTGAVVDPADVDWTSVRASNPGYRFRQAPGTKNPLGTLKFMFPNRFSVYLHDTPNDRAFEEWTRALSHGCIRIEHPLTLGAYLLQDDPAWTGLALADSVRSGRRRWVDLPEPMPIVILYFTAFVEGEKMEFRPDIYERDLAVSEALREYVSPFQRVRGFVADLNSQMN